MAGETEYKLEPAFDFTSGPSILLRKAETQASVDGVTYAGDAEARLELLPRAHIVMQGRLSGLPQSQAVIEGRFTNLTFDGRQIKGFALHLAPDSQGVCGKWVLQKEPFVAVGNESTQMTRVVFHLFNFVDFIGTRRTVEQVGQTHTAIEHIDLADSHWRVEIRSLLSTREDVKAAKAEGGYRLTHVGSLWRDDSGSFSGADTREFLDSIRLFLSFAKGAWCDPACAVGFDVAGSRVWELWSSPREPGYDFQSWFDPQTSSQMMTLFPLFMKRRREHDWRQALSEVVYWYLNANYSSRGIDAGIILAQTAIERLSYEYAVKHKRLLTVNGFKELWASDKFRLLFSSLGLSLDIPNATAQLKQRARQEGWIDAPHALTEIRNSIVHPEHKKRGQLERLLHEAWNLSLWYLEMSILGVCGYSGTYGNRLVRRWVGQVEQVPWA